MKVSRKIHCSPLLQCEPGPASFDHRAPFLLGAAALSGSLREDAKNPRWLRAETSPAAVGLEAESLAHIGPVD